MVVEPLLPIRQPLSVVGGALYPRFGCLSRSVITTDGVLPGECGIVGPKVIPKLAVKLVSMDPGRPVVCSSCATVIS